jgi:hypothetical protein
MKSNTLRPVESTDMRPVAGRKPNNTYRVREHLTEAEKSPEPLIVAADSLSIFSVVTGAANSTYKPLVAIPRLTSSV